MYRSLFVIFCCLFVPLVAGAREKRLMSSKLICYYGRAEDAVSRKCSHVVLPQEADVETAKEKLDGVKILLNVDRINEKLLSLLKSSKVDGLDINLKKLDSKHDISDFVSTIRTKLGSDLYIALSVPPKSEILAKHYDFKSLSKHVDLFVLQTAFLGPSKNVTFHPSRLSGLWDMQNTDSVVDLVTGLGAPLSKLVVTAPVQAFKFVLQDKKHTAPGSPALEVRSITRDELCESMSNGGNWTLERDQDQAGPYVFRGNHWIAFDDPTSIDIKAKYARVRGLAGLALKDLSQDGGFKCGGSLLDAAYNGLSRQSRAPRAAVLHSLEREILETPARPLDTVQVSPYRISRVIDVEGNVHVIRQDTRTEFECSRQGYFVHPRSCGRFYRCVKFDQLSDDFNVFEFDCPAGLTFDSKFEVCVWPGSLSYSSPCSGSSEIAPVPRQRFICPGEPGYYVDPENCRWFFACLDHGKSPLSAYEFRCPFGLVFDEERLVCEWPWLVPRCATSGILLTQTQEFVHGNAFKALEQYDGLGHLGVVQLGGLSGGFVQHPTKVYTSAGQAIFDTVGQSHIAGIEAARLGVSAGIAKAQEDARVINDGLSGGISASVRPPIGNINIVGAGYSAVGVAASASNADIQISHDGSSRYDSVTAFGNVPLVSSVPFPTLNASDLEGFNGGVVANLPQFQYKIKSPSNIFFDTNVGSNLENETVFVNYVSSTPSPFVKVGERYEYANTAIPFVPNSGAKITVVSSTPATSYVESSEGIIAQPVVPIFRQEVSGGPIVSTYNYQSGQHREAGVSSVSYSGAISTARPEIAVVHQQQPILDFGQKLNVPVVQYNYQKSAGASGYQYQGQQVFGDVVEKVQPIQYSYQNVQASAKSSGASGYQYQANLPVVEQKVQFVTPAPVVQYSYSAKDAPQQVVTEVPVVEQPVVQYAGATAKAAGATGYQYHGQQEVVTEVPVVQYTGTKTASVTPVVQYSYQNAGATAKAAGASGYQYHGQQQVVTEVPAVQYSYQDTGAKTVQAVTPVVQYAGATAKAAGANGYQYHGQQQVVTEVPVLQYTAAVPSVVEQKVLPIVQYTGATAKAAGASGYQYHGQQQVVTEVPAVQYAGAVTPVVAQPVVQYSYQNAGAAAKANNYQYQAKLDSKINFASGGSFEYKSPAYVANQVVQEIPVAKTGSQYFNYSYASTPAPAVSTYAPLVEQQPPYNYQNVHQSTGYVYNKPAVQFEESPVTYSTPAPVVVNTYSTVAPTIKETVVVQQNIGYSYPKAAEAVQPVVTYSTPSPVAVGYDYPKPNVVFNEKPAVVVEGYEYPKPSLVFEEKPAKQIIGYSYPKPSVVFEEKPIVVEQKGYSYPKPSVVFEEKPIVVEEKGYSYPKPAVVFEEKVVSTTPAPKKIVYEVKKPVKPVLKGYDYPKPAVVFSEEPVREEPFVKKTAYVTGGSYEYVAPVVSSTVAPKKFSQSVDTSYAYYNNYNAANAAAAAADAVAYDYVSSTPQPTIYVSSTPQPVVYVSSTPKPTFASVITQAAKLEEGATQSPPITRYVFSSLDEQYQTTQRPVVASESPKTTYLPATKVKYVESYVAPELQVTSQAPVKTTMIVKQNDFHPLLSAKLGAQCTCVSNTLKLKKPPAVIVTPATDSDSIEIENYRGQESTTNPIQPAPAPSYAVRKRVRVRPTTTEAYEEAAASSEYSDKELADSVRKGLNLIKAAAKEGAREAFDRYGPGGWRSRDETLQGVVDCQRAGLFRHPKECNKFYACRWDCDKKRFTLHVFNCPVHLTFDASLGACNWPSQGPACLENTLLPSE